MNYHLGLIMDGNRRWAKKNNLTVRDGHKEGAKVFHNFLEWSKESNKIKYITAYAFSKENWNRCNTEVNDLFDIFTEYILQYKKEESTRIIFIGDKSNLPGSLVDKMREVENTTKNNSKYGLQIALNYSGQWDIDNAISHGKLSNNFTQIDLIIRFGGERRLSNYMLYDSAYSELFFLKTLWPDCKKYTLRRILNAFEMRNRRYGK